MMYYVYLMRCSDNSLYCGITTDLYRRFKEHTDKANTKGAKYTHSRKVISIAAAWQTQCGRGEASKLEARLKKLTKEKKELLCKSPQRLYDFYGGEQVFSVAEIGS
ncbi:MAG: GIY-YIG nuclease family protein [Clostridia bacterium]|nr:GIY-YIG nuclease family protein [Clostridia bacterium]